MSNEQNPSGSGVIDSDATPPKPVPPKPIAKTPPKAVPAAALTPQSADLPVEGDAPPAAKAIQPAAPPKPVPAAKAIQPAAPPPKAVSAAPPKAVPAQAVPVEAPPPKVVPASATAIATPAEPAATETTQVPPVKPQRKTPPPKPSSPEEDVDERATTTSWRQMLTSYGVSTMVNGILLLVMYFITIEPQILGLEDQTVVIEPETKTEPPPEEIEVEQPLVLEDITVPDVPTDANSNESEVVSVDNFNVDVNKLDLEIAPATDDGPGIPIKPGDVSSGRSQANRSKQLAERGGNEASDAAVARALEWLASVQRSNGSWDFNDVGKSTGKGELSSPTGATSLALMAFLGAGHTHTEKGKYSENVKAGIGYLLRSGKARPAGLDFRGDSPGNEGMYVQAICAITLAEAHGMTKDRRLRPVAQGAIDFIVRAQHAGGGWRYQPNTPGDTSVVGWQVMALKSAYHSKLNIPRTVGMGINKFLNDVSHANGSQYSYTPGKAPRHSTTSIGLLCRMYMGWKHDNPSLINGVKYLAARGKIDRDIYYNYYASQVMIQITGAKGETWKNWNTPMRNFLVAQQVKKGPGKGSWDVSLAGGHQGTKGGRLYTTCLAVMTLEIYYRVLPLYQRAALDGEF